MIVLRQFVTRVCDIHRGVRRMIQCRRFRFEAVLTVRRGNHFDAQVRLGIVFNLPFWTTDTPFKDIARPEDPTQALLLF